ncbi:2-amino-4-hydroxy-6-hydroxymethyldihydropteridine diphosphokinase [Parapusillimonas sp. SGNA-6]|uniref:2-amino-4-hydroxy-6- hydroxymethyldihydropteridine diphosphokinase n=1 Tax=Sphingobacteriaceae TaxID=84566 RepID=UPI0013D25D6C|nr:MULTISPECIES: 2-amino-4-hydroxy-6-hydroxymethyldihydropteridine diphosphokinase [Sphingobacteriaceae]NGF56617.1 2-amino-4-hydroxy-6-hydroxymethyldihydropteridine diphosphokinase [Parapedobacter sp. SGR-10]NGM61289.1 2-amino-4-hydroxy-6-hydroxymethyldihydropteridine diphosphokinase [Sphingobacterium sp. SGG-5]NGM89632.1 2-amino-4-hydroxy-6-hydroxymethyldihydropteridine diphosphokinase [Parapusillimonas sp. SGNA-6]
MDNNSSSSLKLLTIRVDSLRLRAYIGYLDWEKEKLQDVVVSFSFKYNAAMATQSDDVQHAVNYKSLTKLIIKKVDNQSFHLIETLAETLYQTIAAFSPSIVDICVQVEKPHALRFADNVMVSLSSKDLFHTVLVALGSNIQPEANMLKALEFLTRLGTVVERTAFIRTKPLKFEEQDEFLNGAVLLRTNLSWFELEGELKQIEALMGRIRTENKNAPRVIDLDIVVFNGSLMDEKEIVELPFLKTFIAQLQPEVLSKCG